MKPLLAIFGRIIIGLVVITIMLVMIIWQSTAIAILAFSFVIICVAWLLGEITVDLWNDFRRNRK